MINEENISSGSTAHAHEVVLNKSVTKNIIDDAYSIHLNDEVHSLSNIFCKYYSATHIRTDEDFFAIVFDNKFLHPINAIDLLFRSNVNYLNQIVAYSLVDLTHTKEEHLVVIVNKYDPDDNLESYLQNADSSGLSLEAVQILVELLSEMMTNLSNMGIYGYSINLRNVMMKDGEFLFLREFIGSYPNFYQSDYYIAPELAEAEKAGRYMKSVQPDIYAMGIMIFEAYFHAKLSSLYPDMESYNYNRFENGTYQTIVESTRAPERIKSLLYGLLENEANLRWDLENINYWVAGKTIKSPNNVWSQNDDNVVAFFNKNYHSKKSLSYALFQNWYEGTKFLSTNKLLKWITREKDSKEISEKLYAIMQPDNSDNNLADFVQNKSDFNLCEVLSIIDPNGPIRYKKLTFSAVSLPYMLSYYSAHSKKNELKDLIAIARQGTIWNLSKKKDSASYISSSELGEYKQKMLHLQAPRSRSLSNERFLYSMIPYSRCQSNNIMGRYITTAYELMLALEEIAAIHSHEYINLDSQMVAFIGAKLNIWNDIQPNILQAFPSWGESSIMITLTVFDILQKQWPDTPLPNICLALAEELKKFVDENVHGIEFSSHLKEQISVAAQEGFASKMLQIFAHQEDFIDDYNAYKRALDSINLLEKQISLITSQENVLDFALLLGQKVTVLVSYVLCFFVTAAIIF